MKILWNAECICWGDIRPFSRGLRGVTQSGLDHDQSDPLTMLIYAAALLPLVMHVTQCWYADDSTCIGNIKLKVCWLGKGTFHTATKSYPFSLVIIWVCRVSMDRCLQLCIGLLMLSHSNRVFIFVCVRSATGFPQIITVSIINMQCSKKNLCHCTTDFGPVPPICKAVNFPYTYTWMHGMVSSSGRVWS